MMLELLGTVGGILLVDLALSGDNALVIGATVAALPPQKRGFAVAVGGIGAIVLRILFAFAATFLLNLPWLQAIGGVILLVIAIRLLVDRYSTSSATSQKQTGEANAAQQKQRAGKNTLLSVLLTVLVADITMSLDNVLAVGALANGDFLALAIGIVLSLTILMAGSMLVAGLMHKLPFLLDLAALVLAWTGANMLLSDLQLGDILNNYSWTAIGVPALCIAIVATADILLRVMQKKQPVHML
jgi:YjbE family integral membrane protein